MADPRMVQALTLDERMGEFGFDPSLKRGSLLPFGINQQGEKEWAVPQIGYDMVKALILPGHALQGGSWSPDDATSAVMNIAGPAGFGSFGLGARAVGGPGGKVLGANVVSGPTQRAIELARALRGKAGAPVLHDAPFSNYKIPPDRLEAYAERNVVEPAVGYVPERQISPEALSGDGFLLNFVGDRSNVGQLTTFGGKKLEKPITLDGGRGYSRGEGTGAWASDKNVVNALSRAVQRADGRPVYGTYMPMSGNATDFANMTREAVMSGFDPKSLPKETAAEFNQRFLANKGVDETLRADFPGIASSELGAWFDKSGTRRASLFDFMDKAEWLKKGLPDVTEARFAIQDPHLRHVPSGVEQYGGQSVSLLEPSGKITPTSSLPMAHGTYNADLAGDYLGGFQQAIPRRVLFPDFYAARRAGGSSLATDNRAFQMKTVLQPTNAEWLDGVMKYLDTSPQQ